MLKKVLLALVTVFAMMSVAFAAVNINTATLEELETLPNIGPVKAKAILDYRKANGNFKSVEDIKNVKGIGDVSFDKLKSQISVSGATVVDPAAVATKADKKESKAEKKSAKEDTKADKKAAKEDSKAEKKSSAKAQAPAAEQSMAKGKK